MNDLAQPAPRPAPERQRRRLSDHIPLAFRQALDQGDFEAATLLLAILERIVERQADAGYKPRVAEGRLLVAAHERLWMLQHPEARGH